MLQISIDIKKDDKLPKVWVICPNCNHKDWYYNFWVRRCNSCGFVIGNIYNINNSIDKRLTFHKEGFQTE